MKEKDDFLKKVIVAMAIFLTIFTVVMIAVFAITGSEPSVLIASVFAACLGEGSICGMIKKNKNLLESKNECEQIEEDEEIEEDECDEDE